MLFSVTDILRQVITLMVLHLTLLVNQRGFGLTGLKVVNLD